MAEHAQDGTSDEVLSEQIKEYVEKLSNGSYEERIGSLDKIIDVIKSASTSIATVPKPMTFLIPLYDKIVAAYNAYTETDFKMKLADLLSFLSVTTIDDRYDMLNYRLESPTDHIDSWGHQYVNCLTMVLIRAIKRPNDLPRGADLQPLINQIFRYFLEHNDETDACDLLMEVDQLDRIVDEVDEDTHERVCNYLFQCHIYLPEEKNVEVLKTVYKIYRKLGKLANAAIVAIKLNDKQAVIDMFNECDDPCLKKQLALVLARHLVVLEEISDSQDDEVFYSLLTNEFLHKLCRDVAEKLGKNNVEDLDKILRNKTNLRNPVPFDKDLEKFRLFAAGFYNAGLGTDNYITKDNYSILKSIHENAVPCAVAAEGFLHLWSSEVGVEHIVSRYFKHPSWWYRQGAYVAIGVICSSVRSNFDYALSHLSEQISLESNQLPGTILGCLFGLAMSYVGSERNEVAAKVLPYVKHSDESVSAYAALTIGMVYLSYTSQFEYENDKMDPVCLLLNMLAGRSETQKFSKGNIIIWGLAIGLTVLCNPEEASKYTCMFEDGEYQLHQDFPEEYKKFILLIMENFAFAGTGNVLQVQKLLNIITGNDTSSLSHSAAVICIALISIGDEVSCQMSKRMFEHILQYGSAAARKMVPIAIALTSVSNCQPELVDTLHRIAHDSDHQVAKNAVLALGILAAGTTNTRAANALSELEVFYSTDKSQESRISIASLIIISKGLVHLGRGIFTLSPVYGDNYNINKNALSSLLVLAFACIELDEIFRDNNSLLLFAFVSPAISPRFLVTLDEDLKILPIQVRVGQAVDVVGQAGRPKTITGFQTLETPVVIEAGNRAELGDDTYEPLSPILEGFVICRKSQQKQARK